MDVVVVLGDSVGEYGEAFEERVVEEGLGMELVEGEVGTGAADVGVLGVEVVAEAGGEVVLGVAGVRGHEGAHRFKCLLFEYGFGMEIE